MNSREFHETVSECLAPRVRELGFKQISTAKSAWVRPEQHPSQRVLAVLLDPKYGFAPEHGGTFEVQSWTSCSDNTWREGAWQVATPRLHQFLTDEELGCLASFSSLVLKEMLSRSQNHISRFIIEADLRRVPDMVLRTFPLVMRYGNACQLKGWCKKISELLPIIQLREWMLVRPL